MSWKGTETRRVGGSHRSSCSRASRSSSIDPDAARSESSLRNSSSKEKRNSSDPLSGFDDENFDPTKSAASIHEEEKEVDVERVRELFSTKHAEEEARLQHKYLFLQQDYDNLREYVKSLEQKLEKQIQVVATRKEGRRGRAADPPQRVAQSHGKERPRAPRAPDGRGHRSLSRRRNATTPTPTSSADMWGDGGAEDVGGRGGTRLRRQRSFADSRNAEIVGVQPQLDPMGYHGYPSRSARWRMPSPKRVPPPPPPQPVADPMDALLAFMTGEAPRAAPAAPPVAAFPSSPTRRRYAPSHVCVDQRGSDAGRRSGPLFGGGSRYIEAGGERPTSRQRRGGRRSGWRGEASPPRASSGSGGMEGADGRPRGNGWRWKREEGSRDGRQSIDSECHQSVCMSVAGSIDGKFVDGEMRGSGRPSLSSLTERSTGSRSRHPPSYGPSCDLRAVSASLSASDAAGSKMSDSDGGKRELNDITNTQMQHGKVSGGRVRKSDGPSVVDVIGEIPNGEQADAESDTEGCPGGHGDPCGDTDVETEAEHFGGGEVTETETDFETETETENEMGMAYSHMGGYRGPMYPENVYHGRGPPPHMQRVGGLTPLDETKTYFGDRPQDAHGSKACVIM